jgi:signal transduction histidine kinase
LAIHLEVLRNKVSDNNDAQSQRSLSALDASVRQVDRLVRDFTDYSAPVAMEKKPIDVAEVLGASLTAVGSVCTSKKIKLAAELVPGPWPLKGDATRLRQSFDNLLRNAVEAQPGGGEIRVSARKSHTQLIVDISDNGPGVPPERRAELFEFGKTTKVGGSGIGLPLSQLIVESHGGTLVYQDRNGSSRGATFRLTLPLEELH